jgi:hypothetical protein
MVINWKTKSTTPWCICIEWRVVMNIRTRYISQPMWEQFNNQRVVLLFSKDDWLIFYAPVILRDYIFMPFRVCLNLFIIKHQQYMCTNLMVINWKTKSTTPWCICIEWRVVMNIRTRWRSDNTLNILFSMAMISWFTIIWCTVRQFQIEVTKYH